MVVLSGAIAETFPLGLPDRGGGPLAIILEPVIPPELKLVEVQREVLLADAVDVFWILCVKCIVPT